MYEILDLSGVTGGVTLIDLSNKDKKELNDEKTYFKLKSDKDLVSFTQNLASSVDDELSFGDANEAIDYLDMMGYLVG